MRNAVATELKFWKLALREVYFLDLISEDDFMRMHAESFYENLTTIPVDDKSKVETVFEIMSNSKLFAMLMKEEANILTTAQLPDDKRLFKKMWLSYLLDCLHAEYLTLDQFEIYSEAISFDSRNWSENEVEVASEIIETLRFILVHDNPSAVEYIENPSFELLMYVNDLEYL